AEDRQAQIDDVVEPLPYLGECASPLFLLFGDHEVVVRGTGWKVAGGGKLAAVHPPGRVPGVPTLAAHDVGESLPHRPLFVARVARRDTVVESGREALEAPPCLGDRSDQRPCRATRAA